MYELTVKSHFDAAHALRGYPGECRNLHGHTWDVEVTVGGTELDEIGIVYDFKALKDDLNGVLDDYDHALHQRCRRRSTSSRRPPRTSRA